MAPPSDRCPSRPSTRLSRRRLLTGAASLPWLSLAGCGGGGGSADSSPQAATPEATANAKPRDVAGSGSGTNTGTTAPTTRTWRMGFGRVPPRLDAPSQLKNLDTMRGHADFVLLQEQLPWAELLAGVPAASLVERDLAPLGDYARNLGLDLVILPELTDGLSRDREAPGLLATGRRLDEPAVQQAFADYARAAALRLKPFVFGLAAETNAVRLAAPAPLYAGLVAAVRLAADGLRADGFAGQLMVSVQVEVAWGRLPGAGEFRGIAADLADFGVVQTIGLSSYPYLAYAQPEDIPADYYSRLLPAGGPKAMVVEGGWPSSTASSRPSRTDIQTRYLTRHAAMLDSVGATGWAPLVQADLDLQAFPAELAAGLAEFGALGVMDSNFGAKPALATWDQLRSRPLQG